VRLLPRISPIPALLRLLLRRISLVLLLLLAILLILMSVACLLSILALIMLSWLMTTTVGRLLLSVRNLLPIWLLLLAVLLTAVLLLALACGALSRWRRVLIVRAWLGTTHVRTSGTLLVAWSLLTVRLLLSVGWLGLTVLSSWRRT